MSIISSNKNKSILFVVFGILFLVNELICITDVRPVMYDEAWYASTGYNIASGAGRHNSIVGSGAEINFIFPLFNALFFKIFGYNLLSTRLTAVFFGIITLLVIICFLKRNKYKNSSVFLTLLLFTSYTLFNTIFRFGRPECASLALFSIGLVSFCEYISSQSYQTILLMSLSAILAGLSHPFALLPYCLIGIIITFESFRNKYFKRVLPHLIILLISGIAVIVTIYILANDNAGICERYSLTNIKNSIPFYLKEAFLSRQAIGSISFILIILFELIFGNNRTTWYLAIIGFVTFIIFPILFSSDLMMVGLGIDYVAITAVFIFPQFIEDISIKISKRKIVHWGATCFFLVNLALSYYYNYGIKYEKANSILSSEVKDVIPKGSKVFGSIRLWPFAMETQFISDHYRYNLPEYDDLEYIITCSQDLNNYSIYNVYKPYLKKENVVYSKETRQYGIISIIKCK